MAPVKTHSGSPSLQEIYDFRWDVLDGIIGGKSSIDSPLGFSIHSEAEADLFLRGYGFDPDNPIENAEMLGNYREAITFIRKHFLAPENPEGIRAEMPRRILELGDIRDLLLMASQRFTNQGQDTAGATLRDWACAVLKVMHTIAHIDKDVRATHFSEIQQQIFDRFYRAIHREADGKLFLGKAQEGGLRVELQAFETKPKKARDSIIIKLLHKPENVAEDIFDRVGIRFITFTKVDAIRVVKVLRDKMIVLPPNVKPSRSRNTLVEVDGFREVLQDLLQRADKKAMTEEEFSAAIESECPVPRVNPDNPHSSEFYRAIQFTCRQLIKLKNPLYEDIKDLRAFLKIKDDLMSGAQHPKTEDLFKSIEKIDLKYLQREVRFFYPFEVQVMDIKSFEENERGRSAHSEYKKAQIQTAMRRVMGNLVPLHGSGDGGRHS